MRMATRLEAKFRRQAWTVEHARQAVLDRLRPAPTELVGLGDAIGRRLAEDVRTEEPIPRFRRSGMDGFAVRSEDIAQASPLAPVELKVVERIPCGEVPRQTIARGQAARIMTGGMVPDGADTVVMLEMTEEVIRGSGASVIIRRAVSEGANLSPIGEEAASGAVLLRRGERIGAGQAAVLAALGYSRVSVFRRPKVAILSTGTELLQVEEPLAAGKIRNSNAYMLAAQIMSAGGEPLFAGQVPDDAARAERMIYGLLSSDADLVIATGGVSVGDYDIMADFFLRWKGTTLFNKVAMRPGSPTSAGVWRDKFLLGLSGNPSACFVGFELFVRPVLLGMQGAAEPLPRPFAAYLDEDYRKVNAYPRYIRGSWHIRDGQCYVRPVGLDQSSAMLSIKEAACLIVIPPTKTGIGRGELVQAIPLEGAMFL